MIGARCWPRSLAGLRRRRRPLVRLWDADLNYVATLTDSGIREPWPAYFRRLGRIALALAGVRRAAPGPHRELIKCSSGASVTIDM